MVSLEEVWGYLYLEQTSITTLWKLKKVWWGIDINWVNSLNNLSELEEVWWDLDLRGTSITTLWKLKKVWGNLFLHWINSLIDLELLQEVWWFLDLWWTNIKTLWKLKKVWWHLHLYWIKSLIDLNMLQEVWWYLYLEWTNVNLQLQVHEKIKSWELVINRSIFYENIFKEMILNNTEFQNIFNYSAQLWEDFEYDYDFIERFKEVFWEAEKRDEHIHEIMYEVLKILIRRYAKSILQEKERIWWRSGLTPKIVQYIQEDKQRKDEFYRLIFWQKMLHAVEQEIWEECRR